MWCLCVSFVFFCCCGCFVQLIKVKLKKKVEKALKTKPEYKITEEKTTFSNDNKVEEEKRMNRTVGRRRILNICISKPNGSSTALMEQHRKTTNKNQNKNEGVVRSAQLYFKCASEWSSRALTRLRNEKEEQEEGEE